MDLGSTIYWFSSYILPKAVRLKRLMDDSVINW
jgi:hypothetical protein